MRILILSIMYPNPVDPTYGIFVHQHAQALLRAQADVTIISPLVWTPPFLRWKGGVISSLPVRDHWENVPVYRPRRIGFGKPLLRWAYPYYPVFYNLAIRSIVEKHHREKPFDLIESHTALVDGRVGGMLAKKFNIPHALVTHGHSLTITPKMGNKIIRCVREALGNADRIIVSGPKMMRVASEEPWNCPDHQLETIPLGVDLDMKLNERDPRLSQLFEGKKVILAVGHLLHSKGQKCLVQSLPDVLKKIPETRLVLIGDGPLKKELEQIVQELGLGNYVEFTGNLKQQDVFRYYSVADVMALPSYEEAFGVAYLETWAHGCPVIACEGEGISHLVHQYNTGLLVPPKNEKAIAEALMQILDNPEKARAMGRRGKELVEREFTWHRNAELSLDLYRQLLQGENSSG